MYDKKLVFLLKYFQSTWNANSVNCVVFFFFIAYFIKSFGLKPF